MPPKVVHNIRRYPSRSFYDDVTSTYVTLENLADFVLCGEEVTVYDMESRRGVTNSILAMALSKKLVSDGAEKASSSLLKAIMDCCSTGGSETQRAELGQPEERNRVSSVGG